MLPRGTNSRLLFLTVLEVQDPVPAWSGSGESPLSLLSPHMAKGESVQALWCPFL